MAMGKLDQSIRRYSQAEQIDTGDQGALHAPGLAIAYDRDGQVQKSHEALSRSLASDPGLRAYQGDEVFFVPEEIAFTTMDSSPKHWAIEMKPCARFVSLRWTSRRAATLLALGNISMSYKSSPAFLSPSCCGPTCWSVHRTLLRRTAPEEEKSTAPRKKSVAESETA